MIAALVIIRSMNPTEALICAKASEAIYGTGADASGQATSQETLARDGFTIRAWVSLETLFKDSVSSWLHPQL
jgi:hypothetical protein